jgi:hypothetical protein
MVCVSGKDCMVCVRVRGEYACGGDGGVCVRVCGVCVSCL